MIYGHDAGPGCLARWRKQTGFGQRGCNTSVTIMVARACPEGGKASSVSGAPWETTLVSPSRVTQRGSSLAVWRSADREFVVDHESVTVMSRFSGARHDARGAAGGACAGKRHVAAECAGRAQGGLSRY
jgi:hypothetical protein